MTGNTVAVPPPLSLNLDVDVIKKEAIKTPAVPEDSTLDKKADDFVVQLLSVGTVDFEGQRDRVLAVENMGISLQRSASQQSAMLKRPVRDIVQRGADGGEVGNSLMQLKIQMEALDPNKIEFESGWFGRLIGSLFGNRLKKYFVKYESAESTIANIIRSLNLGREQLARNNVTLAEDQIRMRNLTFLLTKQIVLGKMVDGKLQGKLDREIVPDDPMFKFVQEQLLFPLRQRLEDLQKQLAVVQQGVISLELIVCNNKELMRGVDRAVNVTVSALEVAVTVALALADQRIVLDKINAVNTVTDNMIAGTAKRLRQQAAEINKQASGSSLNVDTLKTAFGDIMATMDEISTYRQNALPQMAQAILEFSHLTDEGEKAIRRMEKGNDVAPTLTLDLQE
jgi:uncharacterized protein YaaN involved in tellurite resistance